MKLSIKTLAACLALLVPLTSQAATFNVTSTIDRIDATPGDGLCATSTGLCTLRAAVMEANADITTTDTINVAAGTYRLSRTGTNEDSANTGDLDITGPVAIVGTDSTTGFAPVINGFNSDRVFHIHNGADGSSITNLKIQNGLVASSTSDVAGAGIYINSADDVILDDLLITRNRLSTTTSTTDSREASGAGIFAIYSDSLTISNTALLRNTADATNPTYGYASGAAISTEWCNDLSLTNVDAISNTTIASDDAEAAIKIFRSTNVNIAATVIDSNTTHSYSSAVYGGGLYLSDHGDTTLSAVVLKNNQAIGATDAVGGGAYLYSDSLTIESSEISSNLATAGAGLYVSQSSTYDANIINTTISGNTATSEGGGIYFEGNASAAQLHTYNTTIANNSADTGGGIYTDASDEVVMTNTLLATNAAATNGIDCYGDVTSDGYNLVGDTDDCTYSSAAGDQTGSASASTTIDPLLDALANNGGDTQTHALLAGSPAIDAGDPAGCVDESGAVLSYDQRGSTYSRTVDGDADGTATCDIGAYEVQ